MTVLLLLVSSSDGFRDVLGVTDPSSTSFQESSQWGCRHSLGFLPIL